MENKRYPIVVFNTTAISHSSSSITPVGARYHLTFKVNKRILYPEEITLFSVPIMVSANHFIVPADRFIVPADHFIVPADHFIVSNDIFFCPG